MWMEADGRILDDDDDGGDDEDDEDEVRVGV